MRRAEGAREILDGPVAPDVLAASLRDLDRLNAWFAGYALTLARVRRAAARVPATRPLVVVDVGGGDGGFARRVVRWGRRARRAVRVVVVERDPATVARAQAACAGLPEVMVVAGDAAALPLAEGSADVVTASLTLHHLEADAAVACLAGMAAAARHLVVVNDLLRSRLALGLVWAATRALRLHPVSRHDGPLSVRRAYSAAELQVLAEKAGLAHVVVRRYPLVGRLLAEVT
jgi:hypothetical protein